MIFVPFCLFSQENNNTTKLLLDSLSKNQIQYLYDGEIMKYLEIYSQNYTDLGGGPNGDGTVDFVGWKEKLKEFVSSKEFKKVKGKPIDEIFDVENQEILNYSEIIQEKGEINRFSFVLKEGDYFVLLRPKDGSPLNDAWFGIFRFENGDWKIIAGD